jgi:TonB-dependent SusC/RagA subfamily outer membrane receptor
MAVLPSFPGARAQGVGADAIHSGPRFLVALASSPSRTAPLDVERSPALGRRIALDLHDASVTDALAAIAARSGVRLVYTEDVLARAGRVTLQADAITTAAALTDVLVGAGVDLVFSEDGDEAVLVRSTPQARRQLGTVVGRVTDARSREGVPGAAVHIEGGNQGAITDQDGAYRIPSVTPGTYTVAARRIGYIAARQQVAVVADQEVTADFALEAAATSLDQVVVTGTAGAEQRRSIGNAVTGISNAPDVLAKSASPNLGTLLNGRAPGVVVVPNSGRLGAGPNIQIRGRSSLSLDNSPLIYIDGVRVNNDVGTGPGQNGFGSQNADVGGRLNDISPEDIESIEIIKGPAAATIYGTEAANGVIQIITKKGQTGKPRLTAQIQTGALYFRDPEGRVPTNLVPGEGGELVAWNGVQAEKDRGTPIFTNGQTRLYNLSLSGGLEQFGYYLSGAYQNDLGIEPNNSLRQFSSHANLTVTPGQKVDVGVSLNYVDRSSHLGADVGASPMLGAEMGHPLIFAGARGFFPNFPPEVPQQLYDNFQGINRFTGSGTLNHRPTTWFSHRLITGIDYTGSDSRALERFAPPDLAVFLGPVTAAGQIFQTLRNNTVYTADYSATARANLTSSISSATSVGGQYYRTKLNTSTLGGTSFPGPGVETVSATAQQSNSTQSQIINTTIGAYFQEQIGFNDRLFLTGAVRVDNNSAFGDEFKWVTYPKVSAAWVASEEPFWNLDFVNTLKLRAAYGESGRQPNAFSALRSYTPVPGPNGTNGVTPGSAGNPELKPERGREVEVGFDADLFDRLHLDFTYFNKRTTDEIVSQPVAPSGGFPGDQLANIGEVSNHGIELGATYQALIRDNLSWEITGNIATNKDRIEDLGGLSSIIAPGQNNIVGFPIGGYFAKRVLSADRDPATQGATNVLCDGGPGQGPVSCDVAPLLFVGTPTPKVTGSIGNTVTLFKRLRLYALVDFKRGNKLYNSIQQLRCTAAIGIGYCDVNYHPENYAPTYLAQLDPTKTVTGLNRAFIQDASFVKLREVSASYTLPENWLRGVGVSRAVVSLAGRELHTWTDYQGVDPEVNSLASASNTLAYDQGVIPPLSQLVATINLTF